ncbi:Tm-1-like ATP-binding domain-containing protein [Roseinatronobacter monicus]|uniref:Uncharacterized protein (UPF0261 family) n=1 Tax=Roseinatronobacter monicus TaxID=393481 RepID=A0A543K361_9RHOB|nr:Tm-1-like ATP-binding domain-containing protein [Roseinatronobacter monicus]TQM89516.1 uncharacterized protein (UPF0261 family) [Roseinatronobacter monicus]
MARVLLIGTKETKGAELAALTKALQAHGLTVALIDISLGAGGVVLPSADKLALMSQRTAEVAVKARALAPESIAALGIGGGTGGEIALDVLCGLPSDLPRMLITTLAFDPRARLADSAITLVPTLCDIEGMNPTLARVFAQSAAMIAGVQNIRPVAPSDRPAIAVSTLGATGPAGIAIARTLAGYGLESTMFHSNGYGGAAFARFVREGNASGVIDMNLHELGRMNLAGVCVPMADRFTVAGGLPRVVLPGALNFLGLGAIETIDATYLARPHYRHSGYFTHVKLTQPEMEHQALALANALNQATGPTCVLVPMGGFSHEDRPGGAIEDLALREITADTLQSNGRAFDVERLPYHINAPETARSAVDALLQRMPDV